MLVPLLALIAVPVDSPGYNLQRTMGMLERGEAVRILFYGQSITVQDWWKDVVADLQRRYPKAKITAENRAIGGFAADLLRRIAPKDVVPFRPDLVVLHDYGGEPDYEALVATIRQSTSAEVLLQTDHVTYLPGPETKPGPRRAFEWHDAHVPWMKSLAERLGCGVVDVRGAWKTFLAKEGTEPRDLLSDDVHLNRAGERLMAEIVSSHLVRDSKLPAGADAPQVVRPRWRGGRAVIEFEGVRVEARVRPGKDVNVWIDGRRPSEAKGPYTLSRATNAPYAWYPAMIGGRIASTPLLEEWTAELEEISSDGRRFRFRLRGSKTGEDGEGSSDQPFRSRSGRIAIDPEDWAVWYNRPPGQPDRMTVTWQVVPLHQDVLKANEEEWTVVANGLQPGRHRLELRGDPRVVPELRIYSPATKREHYQ